MGMTGEQAYVLAKKYTEETAIGMGAIKGEKGDPGEKGFSPTITENAGNTDKIYKLDITTADSSFTTPNLKGADGTGGTGASTWSEISEKPFETLSTDFSVENGELKVVGGTGGSGEENTIESISVNGTPISPDENKNVNITVPDAYDDTALSNRVKTIEDDYAKSSDIPSLSGYATESYVTEQISNIPSVDLTDYATKTYVGEQITNAEHLKREIVTVLPSDTEASDNIIYMLKVESATGNDKYQEYMKIDGAVQLVGDTSVDLTDYAKKTDIPSTLPADGGNADTVNNHTVESDVPVDAKFTDTIYDDTKVKESIDEIKNDLIASNAGAHNSVYRGKYLGDALTTEQKAQISAGTFNDLYIGDYWTIGGVNYRIAAFDYWLNCGDTQCTKHHAVIVPDSCLYNAQMNTTNVTTGAYIGSEMYTTNLEQAKTIINNAFGSENILSHREYLPNATKATSDPTYESAGSWYDSTVELMNERMVYGADVFHNIEVNGAIPINYTINKSQLPLFALEPSRICNRAYWWLRDVVSATYFADVGRGGNADGNQANESFGVRPVFGITG